VRTFLTLRIFAAGGDGVTIADKSFWYYGCAPAGAVIRAVRVPETCVPVYDRPGVTVAACITSPCHLFKAPTSAIRRVGDAVRGTGEPPGAGTVRGNLPVRVLFRHVSMFRRCCRWSVLRYIYCDSINACFRSFSIQSSFCSMMFCRLTCLAARLKNRWRARIDDACWA